MKLLYDTSKPPIKPTDSNDMQMGDVAEVLQGLYTGIYVLRSFGYIISLNNPKETWCQQEAVKASKCTFSSVRILSKGTKLTWEL